MHQRLDELPELVTVDELQCILRCGRAKAYELARPMRVEGLGRLVRIRRSDVERLVRGDTVSTPALRAVK